MVGSLTSAVFAEIVNGVANMLPINCAARELKKIMPSNLKVKPLTNSLERFREFTMLVSSKIKTGAATLNRKLIQTAKNIATNNPINNKIAPASVFIVTNSNPGSRARPAASKANRKVRPERAIKDKILGTIHTYPTMSEANKYAAGEWKRAHAPQKLLAWVEKYHAWQRG